MSVLEEQLPNGVGLREVPSFGMVPKWVVYALFTLHPVTYDDAEGLGTWLMSCLPLDFASTGPDQSGRYMCIIAVPIGTDMMLLMNDFARFRAYSYQYLTHVQEVF